MRTPQDIERYMLEADLSYKEIGDGTWLINDEEARIWNLVIRYEEPVLLFRIKIMDIPEKNREELYKMLLELNAEEMLHSSYGIEGDSIILSSALPVENLDFNEFQAVIDDMSFALNNHLSKIREIIQKGE